ncbi:MAG: DUF983 domain-containing protein [Hyphomicrobiales bacterium]
MAGPAPSFVFPQPRPWKSALLRGFNKRCPRCGEGHLLKGYLGVADSCTACGLDLTPQRADDAPPYFTILIVGHIVVPGLLVTEKLWHPDIWLQLGFWLLATAVLTLWLLPRVKGAVIGAQWAFRMHGFDEAGGPDPAVPGQP